MAVLPCKHGVAGEFGCDLCDAEARRGAMGEDGVTYEHRKYLAALAAVRTGEDYWDALHPWRDDREVHDFLAERGLVESIPGAHDAPWIRVTDKGFAVLRGSGVMAVRVGEGGLPDEPTEDMTTAGGRILGASMRWENQVQRARVVWDAMVKAFRTGELPPVPQNKRNADIPDPEYARLTAEIERLTKERDAAYSANDKAGEQIIELGAELESEIERLTIERDGARAAAKDWHLQCEAATAALEKAKEALTQWRDMRVKVCRALEAGEKINMRDPEWDLGAKEAGLLEALASLYGPA